MKQLIAFDLDGTLLDTAQDFFLAVNILRDRYGIKKADYDEVRSRVSEGAISLATYAMGIDKDTNVKEELIKDSQLVADKDLELFRLELLDIYKECSIKNSFLFTGIDKLIKFLLSNNIKFGIVTNKPRFFAEEIVEATLSKYKPTFLICPEDTGKRKPSPEGLILACEKAETLPQNSTYIGDHSIDIIAGKKAGMRTMAAAYGYVPKGENAKDWQADFLVKSPKEILNFI